MRLPRIIARISPAGNRLCGCHCRTEDSARIIAPSFWQERGSPTLTILVLLGLLNLAVLAAVLLRRLFKHWYFLAQDEQRLEAAAQVERALEQLRQALPAPPPPPQRLAEEELLRRIPTAPLEERERLRQLFRQWGLLDERIMRLRHASAGERAYSALVLGRMQVHEALPDILRLLADGNTEMRLAALRALELLGDPEAVEALVKALPAVKHTAWRLVWAALISCARPQPERLLAHLSHPEPRVRAVAAAVLGEVGSPALLEKLVACVGDAEPEVRSKVAWALGRSGSLRAVSVLVQRTQDPVWFVRVQAVGALGSLGDREAHEPLMVSARDANLWVRQKAAAALYLLWRDPSYLIDLLREGTPDRYALQALVSELEWRGVTWEAINQVNASLPSVREQSRELVQRLVAVGAYTPVLYAIEMHPDTELRLALLDLVAGALPAAGYLDLVQMLASPYLDAATRRAIEKLVGFPVDSHDDMA